MTHSQLRRLSTAAIGVTVAVILLTTLTPAGTTDSGCWFGLPCISGHFGLFALLGVAIAGRYATSDAARRSPRRVLMMTVLALWVFAAADELAQEWWVEHRDGDLVDWLADMAGALVGLLIGSVVLRNVIQVRGR